MPNPTDEVVDKALETLDKPEDEQKTDNDKPVDPKTPPDEKPEEGKESKDDEGYTADDLEGAKEDAPKKSQDVADLDTQGMNAESKYIVDKLPVITTRIMDGDKVKEVRVKSWTQLPDDVTFATKRDELAFMNALTAQENLARDLQNEFRNSQQQKDVKEFERKENEAIREDIARLQREGDLPKFKVDPDHPKFAEDVAYKETQQILEFMNGRNKQYLDEYSQGRPYRHIGFEEAFHMYQRQHPKKPAAEDREDQEREDVARKQKGNRGLSVRELKKPTVKSGTRVEQILDRIDSEEW